MHNQIRDRAKMIIKNNMVNLLFIATLYTVLEILVGKIGGDVVRSTISSILQCTISASAACFWFNTFNRGRIDFNDMYALFSDNRTISVLFTFVSIQRIISIISYRLLELFGLLIIVPGFIVYIIFNQYWRFVWYMHIANPSYSGIDCIRGVFKYLTPAFFGFIAFLFRVAFIPALLEGAAFAVGILFATKLGFPMIDIIRAFVIIIFKPYISLSIAGFATGMISPKWYIGNEYFDK